MNKPFATVEDIQRLYRPLSAAEQDRADALLPLVSDEIRVLGRNYGKDIDARIKVDSAYESVVKIVTCDVTFRILRQNTEGDAMSQESQSGLGYSWSGTFAVAGGGKVKDHPDISLSVFALFLSYSIPPVFSIEKTNIFLLPHSKK